MPIEMPSDDAEWIQRCVLRLLELDPALSADFATPVVSDMAARARWRAMSPEVAADTVFTAGAPPRSR